MNTILYENNILGAKVTFFEEKNLVYIDSWGDHSDETQFKLYGEAFLKNYPYDKQSNLIIDSVKLTKSSASNRAWFSTNVAPRFFKSFAKPEQVKVAIILPNHLFEKMAVDILIKAAKIMGNKADIKSFSNYQDAENFALSKLS